MLLTGLKTRGYAFRSKWWVLKLERSEDIEPYPRRLGRQHGVMTNAVSVGFSTGEGP